VVVQYGFVKNSSTQPEFVLFVTCLVCCVLCASCVQGDTNSTIIMRNVVRAKLVCNPIDQAYKSARSFANLPGFPPNNVSILDGICVFAPNWTDQVGAGCYIAAQG
jgi:hypothetical protein